MILKQKHVELTKPMGYLETLKLIKNAKLVLTDSGGMQKEAFQLKTPCITLRETTGWLETTKTGANSLAGTNTQKIIKHVTKILQKEREITEKLKNLPNLFGNSKAS